MSVEDVKATIRKGNNAADEGGKTLKQAAADAAEAEALARYTIHDSHDRDAEAGLKRLAMAAHEVDLTLRRLEDAVKHANTYLKAI